MPTGFSSTQLSISRNDGVLIIALGAPSTEQEDYYLLLQRNEAESTEDAKLGTSGPHVEFCGQQWSWYRHMLQVRLLRDSITISMSAEAARAMRNDGILRIGFNMTEEQYSQLRLALSECFRDEGYYTEG